MPKRKETENLQPFASFIRSDASELDLANRSVDLILTSPPYWLKRNYSHKKQLGNERTAEAYVESILDLMDIWKPFLRKHGSAFLNVGDSFDNTKLLEIPSMIALGAVERGWFLRQRIIWEKPNGTPHSARRRLAAREEYILHFSVSRNFYSDLEGYKEKFDSISNIWRLSPAQHKGDHPAPFPESLVERVLTLACPKFVCSECQVPETRILEHTAELDDSRPQAKKAMELARKHNLSKEHIAAIRAVGISDAGKAIKQQTGSGKNGQHVIKLAREAKDILGGYFREFTFAKKRTIGWRRCSCGKGRQPGVVLDPFVGSGTTLNVANRLGLSAIGSDIRIYGNMKSFFCD